MADVYYSLAEWRVLPGREQEFIKAWGGLGEVFAKASRRPRWGRLLQSQSTPTLFYSFGEWRELADIQAGFSEPAIEQAIGRIRALCESGSPGAYKLVKETVLEP